MNEKTFSAVVGTISFRPLIPHYVYLFSDYILYRRERQYSKYLKRKYKNELGSLREIFVHDKVWGDTFSMVLTCREHGEEHRDYLSQKFEAGFFGKKGYLGEKYYRSERV